MYRLHQYLMKIHNEVLRKSEGGQTVSYALKNLEGLDALPQRWRSFDR